MIFVNSMSDLFHKQVPRTFVDQVFDTMEKARCGAEGEELRQPARTTVRGEAVFVLRPILSAGGAQWRKFRSLGRADAHSAHSDQRNRPI